MPMIDMDKIEGTKPKVGDWIKVRIAKIFKPSPDAPLMAEGDYSTLQVLPQEPPKKPALSTTKLIKKEPLPPSEDTIPPQGGY